MEYYGYAGSVLYVNLSDGSIRKEELDSRMIEQFLSGQGISTKLAYDMITPKTAPLSPDNALIYGVGPITGTFLPGFPRCGIVSKSPLTGLLTESHTGNGIGPMLKYAGYDHLVVTGRAMSPVYISINNDDVKIKDASKLWGMDTFQASDKLREIEGEDYWTSCIGPAGEKLVRFACIMENKSGMLGRTGLGAVAGSKNLKGIAVRGTKGIRVHDRPRFRRLAEEMRQKIAGSPLIGLWRNEGRIIDAYSQPFYQRGIYSKRNFSEGAPECCTRSFRQETFARHIWKSYFACFGCPCGCKAIIAVNEGEYRVPEFKISNPWGTPMLFIECGAADWSDAVMPAYLTNKYGIDAFETLRMISFAIELYKKGILSKKDVGELELDWNVDTILALIEKIVHQDGIGAILAQGIKGAISKIGKDAEKYAVHIKGLHPTMDLRGSRTVQDREPYLFIENFGQLVDPRGAHHGRGWSITYIPREASSIRKYASAIGLPEESINRIITKTGWNLPRLLKWVNDFDTAAFSLGLCMRPQMMANYDLKALAEAYSVTTGIELSATELLKAGERIWNLQRLFNVREGVSCAEDRPPYKMTTESLVIGSNINPPVEVDDIERMLDEYYEESGWDISTGIPSEKKLAELNLLQNI